METELQYSLYLVAYIDVLGQRSRIRELPFPEAQMDKSKIIEKLKNTAGVVLGLRDTFKDLFEIAASSGPLISSLPKEQKENARRLTKCDIRFHGFSDSIAISVPLINQDENCEGMNGVHACLFSLCSILLTSLAVGHPIRGGVDIGPCLSLSSTEVYGAALEKAYYLEANVADYPRIVVGRDLFNYITEVEHQVPTSIFGDVARKTATMALKLITSDQDGRLFLDFLGSEVRNYIKETLDNSKDDPVIAVYKFTLLQLQYFYNRDMKLYNRYVKLFNYIRNRMGEISERTAPQMQ